MNQEFLYQCLRSSLTKDINKLSNILKHNHSINIESFIKTVLRHRIVIPIYEILKQVPSNNILNEILSQLKPIYRNNKIAALSITTATINVIKNLQQNNLVVIPLKGQFLSHYLFGEIAKRSSGDIDLLIKFKDLPKADNILKSLDYLPYYETSSLVGSKRKMLKNTHKDIFYQKKNNFPIELHWSFFPGITIPNIFKDVVPETILNTQITRLSDINSFLYLCLHGSKHQYEKLNWLHDVAAFIHNKKINLYLLYNKSVLCGLDRSVLQTYVLLQNIYDIEIPNNLIRKANQSKVTNLLIKIAMNKIKKEKNQDKISVLRNKIEEIIYRLCFKKNIKYKITYLKSALLGNYDLNKTIIPNRLLFISYITQPLINFLKYTSTKMESESL
ncbi:nucleotidyltransferase family protein [Candidatus Margulisiibacteriota bacterium]